VSTGGPYRESKAFRGLIAPDRRKQHALILIGGGMLVGAALLHFGGQVLGTPAPQAVPTTPTAVRAPPLDQAEVEAFVRNHVADLRRDCWGASDRASLGAGELSVTIDIAPSGAVENVIPGPSTSASMSSDSQLRQLQACVEREIGGWRFRPSSTRSQIKIPLRFATN
jgi:hypothetical protein